MELPVRKIITIVLVGACITLILNSCQPSNSQLDLIILNGHIVDGTGNPAYRADVGIRDGLVCEIGELKNKKARRIIDASGLCVSPGFIDVHTHVDRQIDSEPVVKNYLFQGVTSVVGGNCGGSRFPLKALFEDLEKTGIAINFASLIGHNTIRREVMGEDDRLPTEEEMNRMQALVRQEMDAGAIGLSTGLGYVPGRYSNTDEIIELTRMIQPYHGIYATHMRNQGTHIKESIEESIRIGMEAGVVVQISHIKLATEDVWGKIHLVTDPIKAAQSQGLEIYMDQYPYTATSSGFSSSFPGWAVAGGNDRFVGRLRDPGNYAKMKQALIERRLTSQRGIDKLKTIYVSYNENHHEYEGKNLAEILDMLDREKTVSNGADLIIEMQKSDRPRGVFFQMAEADVKDLMQVSYNMIGSDGKIEIPGIEVPHPRAYGTFPRVLAHYVRDTGVLTLPDAIRKMTFLPAQAMGFRDRGILKPGQAADVVVFDLNQIQDTATFSQPHQYPTGIPYVMVNGVLVVDEGEWTEVLPGKVLYGAGR